MSGELAKKMAARAWDTPTTRNLVMDIHTREAFEAAFAEILDGVLSQPWMGNATTGQMLDEIRARVDCDYKTVDQD